MRDRLPEDQVVSIHAPHEGERLRNKMWCIISVDVSIHAPHEGERQMVRLDAAQAVVFQSTLPTRGSDSGKVHLYAAFPRIC